MKMNSLLLAMALAMVPWTTASAIDVLEVNRSNPSGNCNGARPVDREKLRNRPLALVNEYGNEVAYATCAFTTSDGAIGLVNFGTRFTNLSNQTATVDCTGVVGEEGDVMYYTKSVVLGPLATSEIVWTGSGPGGLFFSKRVSLSCALPPMVGMNDNKVSLLVSIL